jgi:hypothetical protein
LLLLEVLLPVLLLLLLAPAVSLAAAATVPSLLAACIRSCLESFHPILPLFFCCTAEPLLVTEPH